MGNCCVRGSRAMVWAGDDWGSLTSKRKEAEATCNTEKQRLLGENGAVALSSFATGTSTAASREVKIKITKKELEELVGRMDGQGMFAKEILARLMEAGDDRDGKMEHQRSWRPALQSIPEVN
ncbi:hypothetical protein CJ030_MR0G006496 [Morella rubra]|uniref:Uncharacterized protein n=1 Tax=Morella rubra TaxID=262757 RepID=A0A6A1UKH3_9ROSI|nr:hypothetical protein CJ030_MR0G006496 [Morella rubra]